jgi:hypothetical protein
MRLVLTIVAGASGRRVAGVATVLALSAVI